MANLFILYITLTVFGVGATIADFLGVMDHLSIITGAVENGRPISAIHPNAVAKARNEIVENALNKFVKET